MDALKCDKCGRLYEGGEAQIDAPFGKGRRIVARLVIENAETLKDLDLCPACEVKYAEMLATYLRKRFAARVK